MAVVGYFPSTLAVDSNTGTRLRNAEAQVYAIADTSFSSPLAITDVAGVPFTGNKLRSNSDGIFPEFKPPSGVTQVIVKSGQALTPMTSVAVSAQAAEDAAAAASAAAGTASSAAGTATGAASTATTAAAQAVAVGNSNDTIIEGRIKDPASKTAQALTATIDAGVFKPSSGLVGKALAGIKQASTLRVVVRGDSTVYGHDTVSSDKVAPPSTTLPDGTTHTVTRSPSPWPSVLQDRLNTIYEGTVSVINQGYSGDWVGRGYTRWTQNVGADITLYGYGINDASNNDVPANIRGNVPAYVDALEQMVERDLAWGSGIVFLTPTRQRGQSGTTSGRIIDAYREALHIVADKYGIPVVDVEQFMTNAKRDAWSDDFHFNTKGNTIIGSRMAALFVGGALANASRRVVAGGSKSVPRLHDGWHFPSTAVGTSSGGYYTPNDGTEGQGIAARVGSGLSGTNVIGYLPFYAAEADMVIFPYYYLAGVSGEAGVGITLELDFGVEQGDNYHDHVIIPVSGLGAQPAPPAVAAGTPIVGVGTFYNRDAVRQNHALRVSTPGWHLLTVKATRSLASSTADLLALEFLSWRDWQDMKLGRGAIHGLSSEAFSEATDITQAAINWPELLLSVGARTWTSHQYAAPMLKLTVRTYGVGVIEYAILCTQRPDSAGSDIVARDVDSGGSGEGPVSVFAHKISEFNYTGGTAVPSTNAAGRELQSVAYRASDQSLLLNWRTTNSADGSTAKNLKRAFEYQITML